MEMMTQQVKTLESMKMSAFLGYSVVELYPERNGSLEYELKFGLYNDRPLVDIQVKKHLDSLMTKGMSNFSNETTIPIGVYLGEIEEDSITKNLSEETVLRLSGAINHLHLCSTTRLLTNEAIKEALLASQLTQTQSSARVQKNRLHQIVAFGGQHRTAAARHLQKIFLEEIESVAKTVNTFKRRLGKGSDPDVERQLQVAEEKVQSLTGRMNRQRYWKVMVYDLGESKWLGVVI